MLEFNSSNDEFVRISHKHNVSQPWSDTMENNTPWSCGWRQQSRDPHLWIWPSNSPGQSELSLNSLSCASTASATSVNTWCAFIRPVSFLNCRMCWPIIWTWLLLMQPADVGKKSIALQRASEYQMLLQHPCIRFWSTSQMSNATYKSTMNSTRSAMIWRSVTATVALTTCALPERLILIVMNIVWKKKEQLWFVAICFQSSLLP